MLKPQVPYRILLIINYIKMKEKIKNLVEIIKMLLSDRKILINILAIVINITLSSIL